MIHTAYIHDFSPTGDPAAAARTDGQAIQALGETLAGSGRPLVVAAGSALLAPGRLATEDDNMPDDTPHPRVSERVALRSPGAGYAFRRCACRRRCTARAITASSRA